MFTEEARSLSCIESACGEQEVTQPALLQNLIQVK